MARDKSLCVTYLLWFFFGWLGAHHFYLKRDKQAFVWWSTCGGFLYIGWVRDFWRIPEYVEDANEEPEYMETLTRKMKLRKEPPFNTSRFSGEMLIGYFYGLLVIFAIPEEMPASITGLLVCLGITAGVYIVGNIGREQGPFTMPYLAALACYTLLAHLTNDQPNYIYCSIASAAMFNYYRQYRKKVVGKPFCTRVSHLSSGATVIFVLWTCFFYFNAHITYQDGEKIKLRDSINHFFKSPAWLNFKQTMWQLYEEGSKNGWKNLYDEIVKSLDPTGEANAYKTLGLSTNASEAEIRRMYKKLVVKWHPDRYKGDDKESAQKHFIEIQQAYEILTNRKKSSKASTAKDRTEF